jgi:phosphatidylserine/phosphatidylglycerophosphate/cardiolipin synthase-like enzyme
MRKIALSLCLMLTTSAALAETSASKFRYAFYATNVAPWANGDKSGKVQDAQGSMAEGLDMFFASARKSIDAAFYGIQNQEWALDRIDALVRKKVDVRFIVDQADGEPFDWQDPTDFTYGDIGLLSDVLETGNLMSDVRQDGTVRKNSIMHDKFAVVDARRVWTGTANISSTCMGDEYNANMAVVMDSPEIAKLYLDEFNQMFEDKHFSVTKKPREEIEPVEFSDGTRVFVFFAPEDDPVMSAVIPFIEATKSRLDIGMFFLTDERVANALAAAVKRGVDVRLIYDAVAAAHPSSKHRFLRDNGVDVRVENWGGKMHMKAAVADGKHTIFGSMNWSKAGSRVNDENVVVVRSNESLAEDLGNYFDGLWDLMPEFHGNDPRSESLDSINSCQDESDNDHDGKTDGDDSNCP